MYVLGYNLQRETFSLLFVATLFIYFVWESTIWQNLINFKNNLRPNKTVLFILYPLLTLVSIPYFS